MSFFILKYVETSFYCKQRTSWRQNVGRPVRCFLTLISYQYRSKGNISGGARDRRRREPQGGSGGMLPKKILKSKGLEMLFPVFSKSYLSFTHIANYLLRTLSQQINAT